MLSFHLIAGLLSALSLSGHLFQPSVVRDVFSLCHSAVDSQVNPRQFVLVILINDTLGLASELLYGHIVPPLLQVSLFIKLPTPRKDKKCDNVILST